MKTVVFTKFLKRQKLLKKITHSLGDRFVEINKLTTAEMKKMNKSKVFFYIYNEKRASKQAIADSLQLSIPTVSHNIKDLQDMHLIEINGLYESTGGRKAQIIACIGTARISIGVEILKDMVYIAAVDLYGVMLHDSILKLAFKNSETYFQKLGDWINSFVVSLPYPERHILGVGIAIQGLISPDGETITYSEILKGTGIMRDSFSRYINYPCILVHDAEAAAFAEIWHQKDITDAVYISLNRNLGGAVILNGKIFHGRELRSGTIEHMHLIPNGKPCYCGKKGCLEAYCSANSLRDAANENLDRFFKKLRKNNETCIEIWKTYLKNLALAINNIRRVLDIDILIGGLIQPYLIDDDLQQLTEFIKDESAFTDDLFSLHLGHYEQHATTIGSALYFIDKFLHQI